MERFPDPSEEEPPPETTIEDAIVGMFEEHRKSIVASIIGALMAGLKDPAKMTEAEREALATEAASAADLSGFKDIVGPIVGVLDRPVLRGAGEMSARLEVAIPDSVFEQVHSYALAYAQDRAAELIGMEYNTEGTLVPSSNAEMAITDSTRRMVKQLVVKALSKPIEEEKFNLKTEIENLRDELSGDYVFSRERAALIAQAEVGIAHGQGSLAQLEAMEARGVPMQKKWSTAKDNKVCAEICAENAMKGWVNIRDYFPSGHTAPLGHPNCRCSLIGRVKPNQENSQ